MLLNTMVVSKTHTVATQKEPKRAFLCQNSQSTTQKRSKIAILCQKQLTKRQKHDN